MTVIFSFRNEVHFLHSENDGHNFPLRSAIREPSRNMYLPFAMLPSRAARSRFKPPTDNGAIFVKRIAPPFLPVMLPASRVFYFLTKISHRRSGGRRSGFALTELLCTKIQDGRSSLRCAADRENRRPTKIFLTKIESPAHGSLLAIQPSEAAASARTEGSS